MPANASNMLLQALANMRVPRIAPAPEPSNQADVYATRGILGDGLQAWQTLQGRNENALNRGADRAKWEAQNANNVKIRGMINEGQMDVTRGQGANALALAKQQALAKMLAGAEERAWTEDVRFPHERGLADARGQWAMRANQARPRPTPRVPSPGKDPSEQLFLDTARDLKSAAGELLSSASYGMDQSIVSMRQQMHDALLAKAGKVRALHAKYRQLAGNQEAQRQVLAELEKMSGGAAPAQAAPPPPVTGMAPEDVKQVFQEAVANKDWTWLRQAGRPDLIPEDAE